MSHDFKWSTQRIGNDGYVLEERPDGTRTEWGPMPAHTVPSFVAARRQYISFRMREAGATVAPETTIPDPTAFH